MKRYKLMAIAVPPDKPTGAIVDHWKFKHIEASHGEWVKWEDIKGILQYKDQFKGFKLEGESPQCNCEEKAKAMQMGYSCEIRGNDAVLINSWFCPAHGYKRR